MMPIQLTCSALQLGHSQINAVFVWPMIYVCNTIYIWRRRVFAHGSSGGKRPPPGEEAQLVDLKATPDGDGLSAIARSVVRHRCPI